MNYSFYWSFFLSFGTYCDMQEVAIHWSCALIMVNISMLCSEKKNLPGGTWFLPLQALSLVYFFKRSVGFSSCFCCCLPYSGVPKHPSTSDTCGIPHPTLSSLQAACRVVQKLMWDMSAVQRWVSILVASMTKTDNSSSFLLLPRV